jgi:AMIN domain
MIRSGLVLILLTSTRATAAELTALGVDAGENAVELSLVIEGGAQAHVFALDNPPRVVLDLAGVRMGFAGARRAGDGQVIDTVRYSQYVLEPEPVTRIVVDLRSALAYSFRQTPTGYAISFERPARAAASGLPGTSTPPKTVASSTAPPRSPAPPSKDAASITYMTVSTAYVSAGRRDGLEEGDRLSVIREDKVLGTLQVDNLSSRRASCKIIESNDEINVGDRVAWADRAAGQVPVLLKLSQDGRSLRASSAGSAGSAQHWLRANGFRGRVSGRYLTVQDRSGIGQSFSQPAIDARIEGRNVGGSSYDVSVDVRTRRTFRLSAFSMESHWCSAPRE